MLIHDSDITPQQAEELDHLFRTCFGGMTFRSRPTTSARAIGTDKAIVAHAAIDIRHIALRNGLVRMALLGIVCVDPAYRGRGIAHMLVDELHRATPLPFILVCTKSLEEYYAGQGYSVLSRKSFCNEDGAVKVISGPVMANANGQPFQPVFQRAPIHLGPAF